MPCSRFGCWDLRGPDKLWQLIILGASEALGTSALMFIGCSATLPDAENNEPPLIYRAIAFAFSVNITVMGLGHISGGFVNPAISTAALVLGKLSPITYLVYVFSECFGAVIGMQSLLVVMSENSTAEFCLNQLNPKITPVRGAVIEGILTSILVLLVCSAWDPRNAKKIDSAPIKLGAGIVAMQLAGAKFTGCSMNPARSLAPTLLSGKWENHWIYWVGPMSGGFIMSSIYRILFLKSNITVTRRIMKGKSDDHDEEDIGKELLANKKNIVLQTMPKDCYTKPDS